MPAQIRPLALGRVTAYLEANRAALFGKASQRRPMEGLDFTRMTEVEYRANLEAENVSPGAVEREIRILKEYQKRIDTESVRDARKRLLLKKTEAAEEHLGDYLAAGREVKKRRGQKEITQHGT